MSNDKCTRGCNTLLCIWVVIHDHREMIMTEITKSNKRTRSFRTLLCDTSLLLYPVSLGGDTDDHHRNLNNNTNI